MKRDQQSECGVCGSSSERLLLHNVRHRGTYRRLCSNCVLKTHQGLFCPICLQVYDPSPPPPNARRICAKCPSIIHSSCSSSSSSSTAAAAAAAAAAATSSSSFICPSCLNPNFTFFNVNNKKPEVNGDTTAPAPAPARLGNNDANERLVDVGSAMALVAAAKIAALSMSKAAAVARVEAERRVKEATLAKKRAREALERLLNLAAEEKKGKLARIDGNNGGPKNSNGFGLGS